jgi:hypothetical protein
MKAMICTQDLNMVWWLLKPFLFHYVIVFSKNEILTFNHKFTFAGNRLYLQYLDIASPLG